MWKTFKELWKDYNAVQTEISEMGLISFYSAYGVYYHLDENVYQEWLDNHNDKFKAVSEEN